MANSIIYSNNQIKIKAERASSFIISIFAFLILMAGLIPIAVLIYLIASGEDIRFGLLLTFIIFWGSGFYLLRVVLWNLFGQEILTLDRNQIIYIADYKLFKDGKKEMEIENLTSEIISQTGLPTGEYKLRLKNNSSSLETVLSINKNEIDMIIEKINTCYNKS